MAKTLKPLGDNPSKAEEIAFYESVVGSVPADSYLHGLFTQNFNMWVTTSIRDDASMDIYEEWQAEATASNGLNSSFIRATEEIKRLNAERALFQQSAIEMRKQIVDMNNAAAEHEKQVHEAQYNANAMLQQFDEMHRVANCQNEEIKTLKAMLTAVISETGETEIKTAARMLVREWMK